MTATPAVDRLTYSIEEAAAALGVCRETVYRQIKRRKLKVVKLGSRTLVRREALQEMLDGLAAPAA